MPATVLRDIPSNGPKSNPSSIVSLSHNTVTHSIYEKNEDM